MPLADLITSVSATSALVLGLEAELGQLEVRREADITVLHLADLELPGQPAVDCAGQQRNISRVFKPKYVVRRGALACLQD